ncbi:hypothetical protein LWC33_19220 [Pseudonocardia sp. RS11V-5]|uniref:hypothetical protein n=1 Tax=Pseudonocardia terrae TaxID=2905831 RepID=UPI001E6451F1|nr:hypothetical protein [Pseudonocardia terrae]MCE3553575.1 hypothetical protein [Pseudonocardia terrae]
MELDRHRVEMLVARTEGWAAGLRLAALSLHGAPSPEQFFEHFLGQDQAVADYLIGEVLGGLPADLLDFLRILAVCSPMPTELAARLSGRSDTAALLERLERETALVTGDGPGRWSYRIHALLRAYLALARDVVAWCRAHLECDGDVAVLRARSLLRQDRADQSRAAVLPVLDDELVTVLPASRVHAWLVRAAAATTPAGTSSPGRASPRRSRRPGRTV